MTNKAAIISEVDSEWRILYSVTFHCNCEYETQEMSDDSKEGCHEAIMQKKQTKACGDVCDITHVIDCHSLIERIFNCSGLDNYKNWVSLQQVMDLSVAN